MPQKPYTKSTKDLWRLLKVSKPVELEQTTCYQCDTEIEAFVGQVHPLCEDCQSEFDDWFEHELGVFNG